MIARARLPLRRKLVLCGVFSLGVLVVLLAILNRYYNFVMPHDLVFLAWYNGEAGTAVMVANVPFCWALVRRIFALGPWRGSAASGGGSGQGGSKGTGGIRISNGRGGGGGWRETRPKQSLFGTVMSRHSESESTEEITGAGKDLERGSGGGDDVELAERGIRT